jgi:hypothetical protein
MNKNSIATAPTYTIIYIKPKNSILNKNRIAPEIAKLKIKNKTDSTGLTAKHVISPVAISIAHKNL